MIPVISMVGYSNSGKTTILTKIISELKNRGYKVAVIKHHCGDFDIDHKGKDTYMHMEAGADTVMLSSPNKFALISNVEKEKSLDDLISYINDVDIIITEGYKSENKPKIEVYRESIGKGRIKCKSEELICIISDSYIDENIPYFNFENVKEITDFIVNGYIIQSITIEN
ncbi:molybdopterin-guanine dinucleotide biosynthesis protein B [Gottschalkia acidurici 9a]|uniref:Molybdopterin-guanine dinucleotide biosynthesis protein B n=1 Tax=Gottschalkia acidurici (strain ATCC 7906 / DSM 604 / BCRC 14475 / CIP 104303 / KCTC 5404 / NCIMB 10678 / 9a) TaxID=1128398 RepID=K0B0R7_GOTA9|nr:molybdopterin-guanine dinucleotide biosynthesis protein B [Gottschalkia acidurici]AFS78672.1 molybdopterin-guanine dinucleotide biosynthesis protein B [Gottschalkia acidurici 9a]